MISATYFGEITELESRAVWYSDEEDEDEDDDLPEVGQRKSSTQLPTGEPLKHETLRENTVLIFNKVAPYHQLKFTTCLVSMASSSQYKHFKLNDLHQIGSFDSYGKAFACPITAHQQVETKKATEKEYFLWLLFDSTNQYITGEKVGYFVEKLRHCLQNEINLDSSSHFIILSTQYSQAEHLEYLSNFTNQPPTKQPLPFTGRPMLPPSLIKNQFEAALFEQLTLSHKMATVVCLPNPKNFWFNSETSWPSVPSQIIEHKLNDDNLQGTLIFT